MSASPPIVRSSTFRFSELPDDIGRVIFEFVVDVDQSPYYALVSKKVRTWVEPVIYRKILLVHQVTKALFACTLNDPYSSKSQELFATHVKVVALMGSSPKDFEYGTMASFIKAYCGLQILAVWCWTLMSEEMQELFTLLCVTPIRLSVIGRMFPKGEHHFHHLIFQDVTHLDVVWEEKDDWSRDSLSRLEHLTHLSLDLHLDSPNFVEIVRFVIPACPSCLRVLILWASSSLYFYEEDISYLGSPELFEDIKAICRGDVDPRAVIAYSDILDDLPSLHLEHLVMLGSPDVLNNWE